MSIEGTELGNIEFVKNLTEEVNTIHHRLIEFKKEIDVLVTENSCQRAVNRTLSDQVSGLERQLDECRRNLAINENRLAVAHQGVRAPNWESLPESVQVFSIHLNIPEQTLRFHFPATLVQPWHQAKITDDVNTMLAALGMTAAFDIGLTDGSYRLVKKA